MLLRTRQLISLVSLTLISVAAIAAGDPAAGKNQYTVCAACHGANGEGNPAMNSPKIAGQEDWYLKRQLELFKAGGRGGAGDTYGAQMRPMAMMLATEEAIDNVVAYIGTMEPAPSPVTVDGDAARGKSLFVVCGACHGANGEGNVAMNGPALAGQSDWYLVRQIQNYKNGVRGKSPHDLYGRQMAPMANTLGDDQAIRDVVAYLNSLQ